MSQENVEIVRGAFEAINRGDMGRRAQGCGSRLQVSTSRGRSVPVAWLVFWPR